MPASLEVVLWIVVALLMVTGAGAVLAFAFLGKSSFPVHEPAQAARIDARSDVEMVPAMPEDPVALASRKAAYRRGIYVLIGLAVLTAAEFAVASLLDGSVGLLFILILAKAGVIIQYYMHLNRVWGEEAHS